MLTSTKKYIYKIIAILVIVILVDKLSGTILNKLYQSCKTGICYQENYIMRKTNQDVLFFGSSRAAYHYNSKIIKDTLNMSVYNSGREGTGIYYHYGVLLSTIKRYTPKVIVLDLDYRDIYECEGLFGLDILKEQAPFYEKVSPEFDSLLVLSSGMKQKIKLQSNLYKYNSKFFRILTGNLVSKSDNNLGFRGIEGNYNENIKPLEFKLKIDNNKIKTINKFIKKTKSKNIKLIIAISPYYIKMPKNLFYPLEQIANTNKIKIISHIQDSIFITNKNMFNDTFHLNLKGANIYSSIFASDLKNELIK